MEREEPVGFDIEDEAGRRPVDNSERHSARTLQFERDNGLVNVVVDEPRGIANTVPSVWEVTNPELAVVRLNGPNHATWNLKDLKASSQRLDYDYTDAELREIAGDVRELAPKAQRLHVLFNNNYQDQGQRGAAVLAGLLRSEAS